MPRSDLAAHEGGCLCCGKNAIECSCMQDALDEHNAKRHFAWPHPIHGGSLPCDPQDPCELCKQREGNLRDFIRGQHCREEVQDDLIRELRASGGGGDK